MLRSLLSSSQPGLQVVVPFLLLCLTVFLRTQAGASLNDLLVFVLCVWLFLSAFVPVFHVYTAHRNQKKVSAPPRTGITGHNWFHGKDVTQTDQIHQMERQYGPSFS